MSTSAGETRAEVLAPVKDDKRYQDYRAKTDMREPYRLPAEALKDVTDMVVYDVAEAPLIAFINPGSGGRVGEKLSSTLAKSLGAEQVYNPVKSQQNPVKVLRKIWDNLSDLEASGDPRGGEIKRRMKVAACGGDGTVAWVLGAVKAAQLDPEPAVTIMPLGTGNDLSRTFKWGSQFKSKWVKKPEAIYTQLKRMAEGPKLELDVWKVKITAPNASMLVKEELPPGFIPLSGEGTTVEALSWNYISVGVDAESAYRFHHLRNTKPYLASTRMLNQMWYGICGFRAGWFCCPPGVKNKVSIEIMKENNTWTDLELPSSVKALILLNLQSYGGGRNIFGTKLGRKDKENFQQPKFNDGLIEVVGLGHGVHTAFVLTNVRHAIRLAQCRAVRMKIRAPERPDGEPGRTYMQLDGEPWPQAIPSGKSEQPLVMEVTLEGKSLLVMNPKALKGQPSTSNGHTEIATTANGYGGNAVAGGERAVELTAVPDEPPATQVEGETSAAGSEMAKTGLDAKEEAGMSGDGKPGPESAPATEEVGAPSGAQDSTEDTETATPVAEVEAHPTGKEASEQNEEIKAEAAKEELKEEPKEEAKEEAKK
ncbi:unnamed protein product [Ostreobium quekettii]|uniref:Diacylglycerol kinase n=1 Tax=Ostreobium quekettii TaxID=121088 RepID=A0A8S1IQJ1_9CHLO|nr:unnamed protein product [Ostreobium quekettii]|eukprot:evm.model.scf_201EXC.5 EVM.evm.TU.scf_201EXC.5   scf_201EXC:32069-39609(+)